jgi:hypothetical protein
MGSFQRNVAPVEMELLSLAKTGIMRILLEETASYKLWLISLADVDYLLNFLSISNFTIILLVFSIDSCSCPPQTLSTQWHLQLPGRGVRSSSSAYWLIFEDSFVILAIFWLKGM